MSNFLKSKKYYTKKELDEYVTKLMSNTEITLMEQRERILDLKQENEALKREIMSKKKSDKEDKKATIFAQKKCDEIILETKKKCSKDLLKIKEFALRWNDAFDKIAKKYGIIECDLVDKMIIETDATSRQYSNIPIESDIEKDIDLRFNELLKRVKEKRKRDALSFSTVSVKGKYNFDNQCIGEDFGQSYSVKTSDKSENHENSICLDDENCFSNCIDNELSEKEIKNCEFLNDCSDNKEISEAEKYSNINSNYGIDRNINLPTDESLKTSNETFSFEEALNPVDPLDEILKDLLGK